MIRAAALQTAIAPECIATAISVFARENFRLELSSESLSLVPETEGIRAELAKPCLVRRWQHSASRSFWITSDGTTAVCLTLRGLDLDETVALWVCFDVHRRDDFVLSAHTLSEIIKAEIGLSVEIED